MSDGRECYNDFIRAGFRVDNFQIVILGTADEALTQSVFAALPGLLRDHLPKIVPNHVNLGVEITGLLYIPATVNQIDDANKRRRTAMLLEDVNMLSTSLGAKHFNRIVAYQNIQYMSERFYPGLNEEERVEFLFQMLAHLFLVHEQGERFFDKIGSESGIFSLGAASVYYNREQHKSYELRRLTEKLLAEFKSAENADKGYSEVCAVEILTDEAVSAESVSNRLQEGCGSLNIDIRKMDEQADPHPVWDLFRSDLLPLYYRKFLRYMPARLMRFMQSLSYVLLARYADVIKRNRDEAVERMRMLIKGAYRRILIDPAARYATIAQLESFFEAAKTRLEKKRSEIEPLLREIVPVPDYLRNDYTKCMSGEEADKPSAIMDKIKLNLKREPIVLSLVVRCFLLGIMLVFTFVPLLHMLSPRIVNLGGATAIEWLGIPVLFFMPLIVEFFIKLRRHFKRLRRLKYRLLAANILAVNHRLSKLLTDGLHEFYNALESECDTQLKLLGEFRGMLSPRDFVCGETLLPQTMFNQPLMGGSFCGEKFIDDETTTEAAVRVSGGTLRISELRHDELTALLKTAFRSPAMAETADLGAGGDVRESAGRLVAALDSHFMPQLQIEATEDIGSMLRQLNGKVKTDVLVRMAGINGMLIYKKSANKPVLRIAVDTGTFAGMYIMQDSVTKDYAMLTTWQRLPAGIISQQVCNCTLEPLPELSFGDKLALYYGFYRKRDLAYTIAGIPVRIHRDEMDDLHHKIMEG